jgi:hypothetical protein
MQKALLFLYLVLQATISSIAQQGGPIKPRILISTDIGGTDPDDNQSMIHFLMYSNLFNTEGLISSPSYGHGTKQNILDMIALYEKDLPKLKKHASGFPSANALRAITRQGRQGAAPYHGYTTATEGSKWIVKCASKKSSQPLWILVWGGLDDLAQALSDAPGIRKNIKVYWIGGPNKKWSTNSYAYIAANFPDLWFIENNSSYYGFFSNNGMPDSVKTTNYYSQYINGAGYMGKDFINYYKGDVKMGDTPSLLYMMDGDPNDPGKESWGGSFEKIDHSSRIIFDRNTSLADTVTVCSIIEFYINGPKNHFHPNTPAFSLDVKSGIGEQKWPGYYGGEDLYFVRYSPKQSETISYSFTSTDSNFTQQSGQFVVDNKWPGKPRQTDYPLGPNWYTDRSNPELYDGKIQGGITVKKWRSDVLADWAKRWAWLK